MIEIKMNKEDIIGKIEGRRDEIRKLGVKRVGLFGSYLKGTQKRGSDVDILIEFDEVTLRKYCDMLRFLKKLLRRKIDLVIEKDLKSGLKYVKKEALYVKI